MFYEGEFRDWDSNTGQPIIIPDYFDIMMQTTPIACGMASQEQIEILGPKLKYFLIASSPWLEWPSYLYPYNEGCIIANYTSLASDSVSSIAHRIYSRWDANVTRSVGTIDVGLPDEYNFRIPGVANEYWPVTFDPSNPGGAEAYGWGGTLFSMIIRTIIGFREYVTSSGPSPDTFILAPTLPMSYLHTPKSTGHFTVTNLKFKCLQFTITFDTQQGSSIMTTSISFTGTVLPSSIKVTLRDGQTLVTGTSAVSFSGTNGDFHYVKVTSSCDGLQGKNTEQTEFNKNTSV